MSRAALAQEMLERGWPWRQQTVARLENGHRMVRFGEATALATILRAPLDHFIRRSREAAAAEKIRGDRGAAPRLLRGGRLWGVPSAG
jgi:hypothetical protein